MGDYTCRLIYVYICALALYCFGLAQHVFYKIIMIIISPQAIYIMYVDHKHLGDRNRYVLAEAGHFQYLVLFQP